MAADLRDVELNVTTVAHGGIFVARHEGRVVFVSDALPGERVQARLSDTSKRSFWRAETVRVLEPSPHRREHLWAEASLSRAPEERAGGAEFGHIELAEQRRLKAAVLSEALRRQAGLELAPEVEAVPGESADGSGWRTRLRRQVDSEGRLGPYAARSHRVVPVQSVPLATAVLQRAAPLDARFGGARTVDVVDAGSGIRVYLDEATSREPITETVGERPFRLDEGGFWQVHREAPAVLTAAVQQSVRTELLDPLAANLDLYGGVGLLAAALADHVDDHSSGNLRITSVESNARAAGHATANLAEWPGARSVAAEVLPYLRQLGRDADSGERARLAAATVLLDPPRSGAGRAVIEALGRLRPRQLIYVACDPVALARDLGLLAPLGYRVETVRAFDLFPNTHHLEAVVRLVRDGDG